MADVKADCQQAFHMFYLRLPDRASRERLLQALRDLGILAVSHYVPLHLSPMGRRLGYRAGQLPVTETVCDQIVRLPLFNTLTQADQDIVIQAVQGCDVAAWVEQETDRLR